MNIYKIEQNVSDDYDTYDSAVVIAPDEESARAMRPDTRRGYVDEWCDKEFVKATLIGTAIESEHQRIVVASFNAG
ncbi:MAG TPA: hypothetical protein VF077_13020 [Nitrospiraceae bacterium]